MSAYEDDIRNSQARTNSSYITASPHADFLPPPDPSFFSLGQSIPSTPRDSSGGYDSTYEREPLATPTYSSATALAGAPKETTEGSPFISGAAAGAGEPYDYGRKKPFFKRPVVLLGLAALVAAVVVAIVVPVVLTSRHSSNNTSTKGGTSSSGSSGNNGNGNSTDNGSSNGNGSNGNGGKGQTNLATWGGDGSTVTKADGTTFIYNNSFGGFWVQDQKNPFNNSAKPNSWTPALSETWDWTENKVNGVNLGGLFVLEPFISPALFQGSPGAHDEWDLSVNVSSSSGGNLTNFLVQHYTTFITEEDIAQIAGAGLNWVRLPIPFWAIEKWDDVGSVNAPNGPEDAEPFLQKVCWTYILQVIEWARKYGIRVNLDLHAVPGSQNGYNHSGKLGSLNFMSGIMGYANAQRTLDYIRTITEFISQPQYVDVIPMFSILNEPLVGSLGVDQMVSFYVQAHNLIRSITGIGKGPVMTIHDGFRSLSTWAGVLDGSDRVALDNHPYFAFDGQPNTDPIDVQADGGDSTMMGGVWPKQACNAWGANLNTSRNNFGITVAGEFSNAINDCGLFVRGVGNGPVFGGSCTVFNNVDQWTPAMKNGFQNFILASMDALQDYFFWTWKIGPDLVTGKVQAPLWSYKLGLDNGFIPKDPRLAQGMCGKLGVLGAQFSGTYPATATGGAGAGTLAPSVTQQYGQFPPTSLNGVPSGQISLIPSYTATRAPITLPAPVFTSVDSNIVMPNGWADSQDKAQAVFPVSGCVYPDAWLAMDSPVPASACGATATGGAAAAPTASAVTSATAAAGAAAPVTSASVPAQTTAPPAVRAAKARKASH
ncbi:glycoside hydrolase superfamily [Irpex rosettiformis]|uniref:Glycoside hydrolase superfamily n=1 Tax=Irpex rosettiformis TaxID=378272 RepID=A0ACB8U867_9APHY|nr:glycoside hydrolase superfamily [Irpex rosettiformis]